MPDSVLMGHVAIFADATKIYKQELEDAACLQADMNHLDTWSAASGLMFNEHKCKSQSVTMKIRPIVSTCSLKDKALQAVRTECDLGLWVSHDLIRIKQVLEQTARANRLVGCIKRN